MASTSSTITDHTLDSQTHHGLQLLGPGRAGRYAISTVMNQPGTSHTNAFSSSIPSALKPSSLASFVSTSSNSALAPSNKRAAPPPLKLSESPKFSFSDFETYLNHIKTEWERWEKNLDLGSDGTVQFRSTDQASAQVGNSSPIDSLNTFKQRTAPPPLSAVPDVFFKSDFTLSNPTTFDIVTESSPCNRPSNPSIKLSIPDLATDQILQEKLSHYLDIVELNLIEEISNRSASFFSALGNLQSLHSQTEDCLSQIDSLKSELGILSETVSDKGLQIIKLANKRRNVLAIEQGLRKVQEVWQSLKEVEGLVQSGDWNSALDLIESLEQVCKISFTVALAVESPADEKSSLSLERLKALSGVPARLNKLRVTISRSLETDLIAILFHDLKLHYRTSPEPISDEKRTLAVARAEDRIRPCLIGLLRASNLEKVVVLWREMVLREVREIVKCRLGIAVTDGDLEEKDEMASYESGRDRRTLLSEKTLNLTQNLKALKHEEFLTIARETYANLLSCLEAIEIHSATLLSVTKQTQSQYQKYSQNHDISAPQMPASLISQQSMLNSDRNTQVIEDLESLGTKLSDTIQAAAELSNLRFSKVIGVRTEIHSTLPLQDFFKIFELSWSFVIRCEIISKRMIVSLRGVLVGQAKAFLQVFHHAKITESARVVEHEVWAQVDVSSKVQEMVDLIISSAVEDPPAFALNSIGPESDTLPLANESGTLAKQIDIEGTKLHAVGAVLESLMTLAEYLKIIVNCSLLTTDGMGKIVEFLKAFNSRTCQVVLGAGAMRSAGLKNITAKHLALASQALSIMINLIPYIRECLRRHLSQKQSVMLVDFDKLKRDYQEHQNEIHSKLVSIMSDRLTVHLETLGTVDWEAAPLDGERPSGYVESLFKEVSTLHKVLGRYLSPSALEVIMTQVFTSINSTLSEVYGNLNLTTDQSLAKLQRDADFVAAKEIELNATQEVKVKATSLQHLVNSKRAPPPQDALPIEGSPLLLRNTFKLFSPRSPKPMEPVVATQAKQPEPESDALGTAADDVTPLVDSSAKGDKATATPSPPSSSSPSSPPPLPPVRQADSLESSELQPEQKAPEEALEVEALAPASPESHLPVVTVTQAKPKLTLSQRLAALAINRRSSLPAIVAPSTPGSGQTPVTAASAALPVVERQSLESQTTETPEPAAKVDSRAASRPRLNLKERLAAVARGEETLTHKSAEVETVAMTRKSGDSEELELLSPMATLRALPALPLSPVENVRERELVDKQEGQEEEEGEFL